MENSSTSKINIALLAEICVKKNIKHAVISPGSRNAPLIVAFNRCKKINCHVIIDERCAAFFALGISRQLNEPVVLICTSGTALLNYSPAVAEAYYQKVPLIILSADRPLEWIDQDDSQTIRQQNALSNFVKSSYQLPVDDESEKGIWYFNRLANEAINLAVSSRKGPVHLNIPLNEPLFDTKEIKDLSPRIIDNINPHCSLSCEDFENILSTLSRSKKVMILASVQTPNSKITDALRTLSKQNNIVILSETVSNISDKSFITTIDRDLCRISSEKEYDYIPEILISFGGPLISKFLKAMIKRNPPIEHWYIGENEKVIDTFTYLTKNINISPEVFFEKLSQRHKTDISDYKSLWNNLDNYSTEVHKKFLEELPWSDLKAFSIIMPLLPKDSILHLSNGTSVRYNQLFKNYNLKRVDANRGTSGIDGSTSTAAGASSVFEGITTLITGDTSFFYDSNGLWNQYLSPNLKIIVINNGGGGIFRFIKGPSELQELNEFFETPHNLDIEKAASLYGLEYFRASNEQQLIKSLDCLYKTNGSSLLEVRTPTELNDQILRNYFK
ncbi:MAG: 2-succinyl-5-enolpyruvyl-6-hydroxy-3-cyclohexene-1-carboxylic-acid synthase [Bacteroidales bacterium]|nr:2-succinyl-5-enolpyruvyl-6-hydroxy-3-cyclohexene-1-carboxylic-acid synthase [Bacteroidales bacterium]